jgi:hypothetical protein
MSANEIAVLRIELEEIEPLIWRRVAVRASSSLHALHRIIQITMGWLDYHLWEFDIDDVTYGVPDPEGNDWGYETKPATRTKLARILDSGLDQFSYTYDMGDNWLHRIIIERIETADPKATYPCFLGGERRCPPEDCGSVPGYYDFIDAISAPDRGKDSRKKREMLRWYGRPYDPDNIEPDRITSEIARMASRPRRRQPAEES